MNQISINLVFILTLLTTTLFSCSSPSPRENRLDVRPGVDGVHRVVIITKNQVEGSREALNQADQYCKEIKKSAYFFNSVAHEETPTKQKTPSQPPPASKPAADDAETEKSLTIDMLFKCL